MHDVLRCTLLLLALTACWGQPRTQSVSEVHVPITGTGMLEGRDVAVTSEVGGRITRELAAEGDEVTAGDVLVRLDDAQARAQVAQAQAALAAAEADLARLKAGPRPAEVVAAEAAIQRAEARAQSAAGALVYAREAITNPLALDLEIAQAQMQRDIAEEAIDGALAQLDAEKLNYHIYVELRADVSDRTRQSWDLRIRAAEAAVTRAEAERDAAQADLSALYAIRAVPLEAQAQLHAAEAAYTATLAAVVDAQAQRDVLLEGPLPEAIIIAEAQVAQARAVLSMALTSRSLLTLTAPISGVVSPYNYRTGEIAPLGLPIVTLTNLDVVYLTIYVPETRVTEVESGQRVDVTVDGYRGAVFPGTVERIAGSAEYTPGNVVIVGDRARRVFAVRVRIPNPDHRLRPGLPATATVLP